MSKYDEIIQYCFDQIISQDKKPLLIAITGDSGSGKSYYSNLLKEKLKSEKIEYTYINADDFLIPRKDRISMKHRFYEDGKFEGKSHWELLENMFYLDKFKNVIDTLRSNKLAIYKPYDRLTGDISDKKTTVKASNIILFDTSMLLEQMDFIILLDVTRKNILDRKVKRDSDIRSPEKIIEMHQKVQGYYWDRLKLKNSNIIIDNNDFNNPFIKKKN